MRKPTTLILATSALVGAAVIAVPAALATTSDRQIAVHAGPSFPKATGSAQYQSQPGQREFQVELNHLKSLAGRSVLVRANGVTVGQAKVSSRGIVEFTRNTELRQSVPQIAHGSTVTVVTGAAHTLVASGTF
ncbi:MAG TPA: hypothetical protein VMU72_02690 [Gaiellaceae bacterium]|nr:hypothetical protein [Gaiellaceae bacterium]